MAPRKKRPAGNAEEPRSRPLRKKLDPRLDILLGLGKTVVSRFRMREHAALRGTALELGRITRKVREALVHETDPNRRLQIEQAALAPFRERIFRPFTAGIRFPEQQHDLDSSLRRPEPLLSVLLDSSLSARELKRLGFLVRSRTGDLCSAWVPWSRIASKKLDEIDGIRSVELARASTMHLDHAMHYTGLDSFHAQFTGAGVVIGVADRFIDFQHSAFTTTDSQGVRSTCIERIWVQGVRGQASGSSPAVLSVGSSVAGELAGLVDGIEYTRAEINQSLANAAHPYAPVDHRVGDPTIPDDQHGTQVCGAALGRATSGFPGRCGAAPGSDLIFVHLRDDMPLDAWRTTRAQAANQSQAQPPADPPSLGIVDTASIIEACTYIFARAKELDRPCVICLSRGDPLGPHDDTSQLEKGLDALLDVPRRVIVVSAGNDQGMQSHASGSLAPSAQGGSTEIDVVIGPNAQHAEEIQIWFDGADEVLAEIEFLADGAPAPEKIVATLAKDDTASDVLGGKAEAVVQVRCPDSNGDTSVTVVLLPDGAGASLSEGIYTIRITATAWVNGNYQAWMSQANAGTRFQNPDPSQQSVTTPATAKRVIAVGAHGMYNAAAVIGPPPAIYAPSGTGKSRDGRDKPDLCAPTGVQVPMPTVGGGPGSSFGYFTGTSAAAPIVAGAAAALIEMLAKSQPGVVPDWFNVRDELRNRTSQGVQGGYDSKVWGAGWLDFNKVAQAPLAATAPPIPAFVPETITPSVTRLPSWEIPVPLNARNGQGGIEVRVLGPADEIKQLEVELPLEFLTGRSERSTTVPAARRMLGEKRVAELLDASGVGQAWIEEDRLRLRASGSWLLLPRLTLDGSHAPEMRITVRSQARGLKRPSVRVLQFQGGRTLSEVVH